MSELKPCPFCNNPNTQYSDSDSPHTCCDEDLNVYAHCEHCNTKIKGKSDNEVEAIWNTRPIEDAQSATIARLTAVLRQAEWVYSDSRKQRECPVCRRPDNLGHHNNCKLNNALTEKEGEK